MLKQLSLFSLLLVGCAAPAAPAPTPSPAKGTIQFRALIKLANAETVKAARTSFTAEPFDSEALRLTIEKRNNPGPKPSFNEPEPKASDAKFQTQLNCFAALENGQAIGRYPARDASQEALITSGQSCKLLFDLDHAIWAKQQQAQLEALGAWNAKATAGLAEAQLAASKGRKAVSWQTDLEGKAQIFLDPGEWFISGSFDIATAKIEWQRVQVTVTSDTTQIELNEGNTGDAPKG